MTPEDEPVTRRMPLTSMAADLPVAGLGARDPIGSLRAAASSGVEPDLMAAADGEPTPLTLLVEVPVTAQRRSAAGSVATPALIARPPTGIRIRSVEIGFEDFLYRVPIKFGGRALDRVTLLNVQCVVESRDGSVATGFGSMPLGNVWSFPARSMSYQETLGAMKELAVRIAALSNSLSDYGHPIDLTLALEAEYLKAAEVISARLAEPLPKLCALVVGSPFDAALHDGYGLCHQRSAYQLLTPEFLTRDLGHYLGAEFRGKHLSSYVRPTAVSQLPLYHLVGALDPIDDSDIGRRINDGLPETLPEWIRYNGLRRIKVKLAGDDLDWDVERVAAVHAATSQTQAQLGVAEWFYSLDFNENCHGVDYVLDFIAKLDEKAPGAFQHTQYIEQPTARDLTAHAGCDMRKASSLVPVVIDESLTDPESLLLAQRLGYSGAALKACKGISQSLLITALARKRKLFLCVQDLTCPGASLVESVGLAAHVPGVAAVEANARQYVPSANRFWEQKFPGLFQVKDGHMYCGALNRAGLGF